MTTRGAVSFLAILRSPDLDRLLQLSKSRNVRCVPKSHRVAGANLPLGRPHPTPVDPSVERRPRGPNGFGGLGRCNELRNHAHLIIKPLSRVKYYFMLSA